MHCAIHKLTTGTEAKMLIYGRVPTVYFYYFSDGDFVLEGGFLGKRFKYNTIFKLAALCDTKIAEIVPSEHLNLAMDQVRKFRNKWSVTPWSAIEIVLN